MADSDSGGSFVAGFLMGGIVGTVVGILLAPKPGSETRADLLEQSELLRARAEELAARVRERVGPAMEGVRERVGPAVDGVRGVLRLLRPRARVVRRRKADSDGAPEAEGEQPTQ